ncbi:MAG: MTH938/NDUFAF3 family protein, partial [Candidatus Bipolaricaulia bacterium]
WITGKDPDLLVVGTGSTGRMKVTEETRSFLKENGIDLWIGETQEAADYLNARRNEENEEQVAGAFHLTC